MVISKISKKLLKYLLSVIAVAAIFMALNIGASAQVYNKVVLDIPRISQRPNTGDCAIASMSTVEAYFHGLPSGDYTSKAYQSVYAANGYSIGAMWSSIGYRTVEHFNMQEMYNQLKTGTPVIVHRTSSHYSVVYGYDGSASSLSLSGFLIIDVDDSYNTRNPRMRLDAWKGYTSLDRMVFRVDGLTIQTGGLKINTNHPAKFHEKGDSFTSHGRVISNNSITNVIVAIKNSAGSVLHSYSANPNSSSFALSNASSSLPFAKLGAGNYIYSIWAKDSSGEQKTYTYSFKVISGTFVPADPTQSEIKKVDYKAVVTADPCLNLRKGIGLSYDIITVINKNEIIDVTAECDGWATVKYNGYVGWVSMDYLKKYTEPKADTNESSEDDYKVNLGRITSKVSLRKSDSTISDTVKTLPKNSIVKIIKKKDKWYKVKYNGSIGYVLEKVCVENAFDVDNNGYINANDALRILESSVQKNGLSKEEKERADADGNGRVDSSDSLYILQVATGKAKI